MTLQEELDWQKVRSIIAMALEEDIGSGDVTTELIVDPQIQSKATIIAKEDGVICGLEVTRMVFEQISSTIQFVPLTTDGAQVGFGDEVVKLEGPAKGILMAERTALNFLQRLSGIATLTAKYVKATDGTKTRITDTRKTTPGLRLLEKYAVRVGGGTNHRFGLYAMILIKDNHILVAGGAGMALRKAQFSRAGLKVEIETRTLQEISEVLPLHPDRIMLDNMDLVTMREAVSLIRKFESLSNTQVEIEASGGINLENIRTVAETGVDFISVGALTHSTKALDLSLLLTMLD